MADRSTVCVELGAGCVPKQADSRAGAISRLACSCVDGDEYRR